MEEKVTSNLGEVFVYKVENYFLTIIPEKRGFLWIAPDVTTTKEINDKNDKVRTIGWVSCQIANKSMTMISS